MGVRNPDGAAVDGGNARPTADLDVERSDGGAASVSASTTSRSI